MMRAMAVNLSMNSLENVVRLLVPMGFLAVLFLLSVTALPIPGVGLVKPALLLMCVYYWSIYRPSLMPPALCFAVGLLLDIMTGLPLGVNAMILTLVQWVVRDQRKFLMGQAYFTIWCVFALIATLSLTVQWVLYGMASSAWMPLTPLAFSLLATILLFPVVTMVLIIIHRVLPSTKKAYD